MKINSDYRAISMYKVKVSSSVEEESSPVKEKSISREEKTKANQTALESKVIQVKISSYHLFKHHIHLIHR